MLLSQGEIARGTRDLDATEVSLDRPHRTP